MDITEFSILHHVGIVLVLLWILSYFSCCHPIVYFVSFIYLYQVNECYTLKLRRRLQFQEKKKANQKRLLSDSETVRWLNHAVKKVWPICMEHVASQKILLPIIPWFLDKYKPWTARKAMVQELYLGRSPPMFTEIRVLRQSSDDDHLVLELGMSFISAEDMNATLAVKLTKRLGFGIWTKMHITGMHVEGKVLVGVKFLPQWPFLGRLRICFVEPPYFQMTVKPIFNHGLDVTELPGIAGWLDKILAVAFEQTLVEPNMLVVDMEKFASQTEQWFSMDEKCPIAFAKVEIVEAAEMKPSDLNGLADPYVRGQLGPYKFHTKIQKRTLAPKWQEEFKIPISTWESPNVLLLEVRDKDHFVDDILGDCSININELRSCQRYEMWLPLQHIDMGRLHVAVTVIDQDEKEHLSDKDISNKKENTDDVTTKEAVLQETNEQTSKMGDEFEPIDIKGHQKTRVWLHHPGSDLTQTWEPRKKNDRRPRTEIHAEDNNSIDSPGPVASEPQQCDSGSGRENPRGNKLTPLAIIRRSLKKLGSVFDRSPRNESPNDKDEVAPTPRPNIRAVGDKVISVKFVMDDHNFKATKEQKSDNSLSPASEASSPGKGHKGGMAESILKQAGKSAHHITHVFHKKSSKNSNECPGSTAADGGNQDSGSTNEEALPSSKGHSPRVEGIILDTASLSSSGKEPPNFEDEEKYLEKKLSFNDKDSADGSTAGCGACIIKDATSQGAESTNDDAVIGLQESLPRKSSSRYADRTNGDVRGGIEVEASSKHENFEGSLEEKR